MVGEARLGVRSMGSQVLSERVGEAVPTRRTYYVPNSADSVAGSDTSQRPMTYQCPRKSDARHNAYIYGPNGTPFEQVNLSSGTITYLVADALGSVRGVVSATGSLSASTSYDAWGNPETSGGLSAQSPFGFAGGYTDPSGLVYVIGRYYDPATGQFLNLDPLVDETGQPYAYTGDDPVDGVDPSGMNFISQAWDNTGGRVVHAASTGIGDVESLFPVFSDSGENDTGLFLDWVLGVGADKHWC